MTASDVHEPPPTAASPDRVPLLVLGAMIGLYIVVFGSLTWRQQSNFGTFGFDMGIYDQGIWLLSRFHNPFVTVRGLNYFGHHVNPITLLFVPAYWLGAGPHFLYVVETVWVALGAIPLWLLGRDRFGDPWRALVVPGAYLLYPSLEWINWWHFHPDALAITPLLFAWWLASRRQWKWFWVAVGITLLCKEDASLAIAMLGVLVAFRYHRRLGVLVSAAGVAWFMFATRAVIPLANGGGGPFYQDFFPGLGTSLSQIAFNSVRHPSRIWHVIWLPDRKTYYWKLVAPVALLPFAALPVLLIGTPQVAVNVISGFPYTHEFKYHYTSLPLAAIFLATVEGIAILGTRPATQRFLLGSLAATALIANIAWSPSPISTQYERGEWAAATPRLLTVNRAVDMVPGGAGVSATYYMVPHLTHRVHIYEFPNPWLACNWGVNGEHRANPRTVDYLVLDRNLVDKPDLLSTLTGPTGAFRVVFDRDNIMVARRVPGRTDTGEPPASKC